MLVAHYQETLSKSVNGWRIVGVHADMRWDQPIRTVVLDFVSQSLIKEATINQA